jgi:alkanesulfonate monooxygenase SsuD/methylene tetrahydromethanopterin reductase-like flavin-dependent oxidoreductase (luciferase family)
MLRLAQEEADGVVVNWCAASDLDYLNELPACRDKVFSVLPIIRCEDEGEARAGARRFIAEYLSAPGYAAQQVRLGRGPALEMMWERMREGDRQGAAMAVPESVIDELIIYGSPRHCRTKILEYSAQTGAHTAALFVDPGSSFLNAGSALAQGAESWK